MSTLGIYKYRQKKQKPHFTSKVIFTIVIFFISIICYFIFTKAPVFLLEQQNNQKAKLFLQSETPLPAAVGKEIIVSAWLQTFSQIIGGYDMIIHFDPSVVELTAVETQHPDICSEIRWQVLQTQINEANTTGTYSLSGVIYDQNNLTISPTPIPANTSCMLALFTFKAKTTSPATNITFDFSGENISSTDTQVVSYPNYQDVLGSVTDLPISIISSSSATLRIEPQSSVLRIGESRDYNVILDTEGNDVIGVDAILQYDPDLLDINSASPGAYFTDNPVFTINPAGKTVNLLSNVLASNPVNGSNITVGSLHVISKSLSSSGSASINFSFSAGERNDSNVIQSKNDNDILTGVGNAAIALLPELTSVPTNSPIPTLTLTPEPTPTPTVLPTATPTPTVLPSPTSTVVPTPTVVPTTIPQDVTLPLSLAGRNFPNSQKSSLAQVQIFSDSKNLLQSFTFLNHTEKSITDNGELILSNLQPGIYYVAIKPLGYLQELFKLTVQSNYVIKEDTRSVVIRAGDVDMNGIVNALDYAKLRLYFKSSIYLTEADYDKSGEVNGLDYRSFYDSIQEKDCSIDNASICAHFLQ